MRAVALLAIVITAALTQSAQAVVLNEDADWDRTWQIAKWVSAAETEVRGLKLRLEFWEDDSAFNFKLAVTNTGDTACILRRPTQELFDFTVLRSDEVVWHYNRNRFFTQTPHTLTIDPGETQDYTATWDGKDCRGIPLKTWLGIDLEAPPVEFFVLFDARHRLALKAARNIALKQRYRFRRQGLAVSRDQSLVSQATGMAEKQSTIERRRLNTALPQSPRCRQERRLDGLSHASGSCMAASWLV